MMRAAALVVALSLACGSAEAASFVVRGGGAATALAVDRDAISEHGLSRGAWTYELFWKRGLFAGRRTQVLAVLQSVNCETKVERALATVQYDADGTVLARSGPDAGWTRTLHGSNTDYILNVLCGEPDGAWSRSKAANVFAVYRDVWSR